MQAGELGALVPARPGPRRAHKLTEEIVAFAAQLRAVDPALRSAQLVEAIEQRYRLRVHPHPVERALARAAQPKRGPER